MDPHLLFVCPKSLVVEFLVLICPCIVFLNELNFKNESEMITYILCSLYCDLLLVGVFKHPSP